MIIKDNFRRNAFVLTFIALPFVPPFIKINLDNI